MAADLAEAMKEAHHSHPRIYPKPVGEGPATLPMKLPAGVVACLVAAAGTVASLRFMRSMLLGADTELATVIGMMIGGWGPFVSVFLSFCVYGMLRDVNDEQECAQREFQRRKEGAEEEASKATCKLRAELQRSLEAVQEAHGLLEKASRSLDLAAREFQERAFAPFWNAIETAGISLGEFRDKVDMVSNSALKYRRVLASRDHTFPAFPVNARSFADPSPVVNRLNSLVRSAQRDFEFWDIFERRETRRVLVEGFSSFGGLLEDIRTSIDFGFEGLNTSLSAEISDLTELAERDYENQEKQVRLLSEIATHQQKKK